MDPTMSVEDAQDQITQDVSALRSSYRFDQWLKGVRKLKEDFVNALSAYPRVDIKIRGNVEGSWNADQDIIPALCGNESFNLSVAPIVVPTLSLSKKGLSDEAYSELSTQLQEMLNDACQDGLETLFPQLFTAMNRVRDRYSELRSEFEEINADTDDLLSKIDLVELVENDNIVAK